MNFGQKWKMVDERPGFSGLTIFYRSGSFGEDRGRDLEQAGHESEYHTAEMSRQSEWRLETVVSSKLT